MYTGTQTYTITDVRKAFEMFSADLSMLAYRTQAMDPIIANDIAADVCTMAQANCLTSVHVQLRDASGNLVRAHHYAIEEGILSDSQRPGENRWPRMPDGIFSVLVTPLDNAKLDNLKQIGKLKLDWTSSNLSTDYSGMQSHGHRLYSSNSYGLQRRTYINY